MRRKDSFWRNAGVLTGIYGCIFIVALFGMMPLCYSQGGPVLETEGVKELRGIVTTTDWVNSTFVVRWLAQTVYDEMTFKVTSDTKVFVQNFPGQLSDIQESDDVLVKYVDNGYAGLKVISITDTSPLDGD
ncbi:MAG: hypothetical protein ABIC68_05595 [Candidatus Omnitrophota bacterium]